MKTREQMIAEFPNVVPKSISHNRLQSMIANYANLHFIIPLSIRDSRMSPSGQPDLILIGEYESAFFEVKSPKGKTTKMQEEVLRRLGKQYSTVGVVRWNEWPRVKKWIEDNAGTQMIGDE